MLSLNGECRIMRAGRVALSEINYAAFGMAYGPQLVGTARNPSLAIAIAREVGFTEAIMDGKKISLEPVGLAGVA